MIISPITTDSLVTDLNGKEFIPTASISCVDAHYAFIRYMISVDNSFTRLQEYYQKPLNVNHMMFTNWLSEKISGKFSCNLYSLSDFNGDIYFEDMQDAVLFKMLFSK